MEENIKELDVYEFTYNKDLRERDNYINHCFDGILIVRKSDDGELYLQDTYTSDGRVFSLKDAKNKGNLDFMCNLNNVDKIDIRDTIYYEESDVVTLHCQHGYQTKYYLKKNAKKSATQMVYYINKQLEDKQNKIESLEHDMKMYKEKLKKVKSGELDIYL